MALIQESVTRLANFYTSTFPMILYTTWVVIALSDLFGRDDLEERIRILWAAAVLFVPLLGPLTYLLLSDTRMSWNLRMLVTAGGALFYIATTTLIAILT